MEIEEKLDEIRAEIGSKGTRVKVWNHLDENNIWFKEPMKATETKTTSEVFHNDIRIYIDVFAVYCEGYKHPVNTRYIEKIE